MKNIKISALALISFIALNLVSCSSSDSPASTPAPTSELDYYPRALNNQWIYVKDGVTQAASKMVSINTVSTNDYYTFSQDASSPVTATTRIRKSGNNYYYRVETATTAPSGPAPGTSTTGNETVLLKDDLPVGGTWTDSFVQTTTYSNPVYPPADLQMNITSTILAKDISLVVRGVTYTNVIKIDRHTDYTGTMQSGSSSTWYWFAKGIGPIKINTVTGSGTTDQELDSHIIN